MVTAGEGREGAKPWPTFCAACVVDRSNPTVGMNELHMIIWKVEFLHVPQMNIFCVVHTCFLFILFDEYMIQRAVKTW